MGPRQPQTVIQRSSCEDWVPPAELHIHLQALPKVKRPAEKEKLLLGIIERDVIPRLLLANRPELSIVSPPADEMAAKLAARVDEFSELVINADEDMAIGYVEMLRRQQGITMEALFQDLLAPTARRLGVLWEEDINDFLDVTRGMGRLQQIVRTFSDAFDEEARKPASGKRVLLMPVPGEQHTFGISLLREHFLREGCRVWCGPVDSAKEIVALVKRQWFDIAGLSASALETPAELAGLITKIRKTSANRSVRILVGGRAFDNEPHLVAAVGADATARDGREAVGLLGLLEWDPAGK